MSKTLLVLSVLFSTTRALADHAAQIDRLVVPLMEGEALVGCVVGIIDGEAREVHAYGEVHRGEGDRPTGQTLYEIGSISKAFTGTLLADMHERGLVQIDQPLQDLLPEGVKSPVVDDQPIKLVHLATHTSGLPRLPTNMDPGHTNPYADYTADKMYAFLGGHDLRRTPGEYEYSNYAMGLLGQVLAERSGKSYEELVVERICDPLEMNDTRITLTDEQMQRFAPAYNGDLAANNHWDLAAFAGAGGLRSTVDDMLKFAAAALAEDEDRPVGQAEAGSSGYAITRAIHLAWEKRHGEAGEIGVGLGWHIARDGRTKWHNGQTGGSSSALFIYPPRRLAVVVLANTATDKTTTLGERIIQSLLGIEVEPIEIRKAVQVDAAVLEKYVGKYALSPFFAITVTLEDGRLMAQATGQDKFQLFAESPNEFFYKVVDAQITFDTGDDGEVAKLTLHQGGRDLPGKRMESGTR
jgi:CubicO group peptidase (beta-lactamase class C family)